MNMPELFAGHVDAPLPSRARTQAVHASSGCLGVLGLWLVIGLVYCCIPASWLPVNWDEPDTIVIAPGRVFQLRDGTQAEQAALHRASVLRNEGVAAFRNWILSTAGDPARNRAAQDRVAKLFSSSAALVLATGYDDPWSALEGRAPFLRSLEPYVLFLEQVEWSANSPRTLDRAGDSQEIPLDPQAPLFLLSLVLGEPVPPAPSGERLSQALQREGLLIRTQGRVLRGLDILYQPLPNAPAAVCRTKAWDQFGPWTTRSDVIRRLGPPAYAPIDPTQATLTTASAAPCSLIYLLGGYRLSFEFLSGLSTQLAAISIDLPFNPSEFDVYSQLVRSSPGRLSAYVDSSPVWPLQGGTGGPTSSP